MSYNDNFEGGRKPIIIGEYGDYKITFVSGKSMQVKDIIVYKDFLAIQSNKTDKWKIADRFGNLSETFSEILGFEDGFFVAKDANDGTIKFRDLIGRTSDKKTDSGKAFYKFTNGEIDISDFETYWFKDVRYLLAVVQEEVGKIVSQNPAEFNSSIKCHLLTQYITKQLQETINNHFITI